MMCTDVQDGVPVPVVIAAYSDKSFDYKIKSPPASYFLKRAAKVEKGSSKPGHETGGTITVKHIYEIAKVRFNLRLRAFQHEALLTYRSNKQMIPECGWKPFVVL